MPDIIIKLFKVSISLNRHGNFAVKFKQVVHLSLLSSMEVKVWLVLCLSQVIDIFNLNQTPFPEIILEDDQVVTGTRG